MNLRVRPPSGPSRTLHIDPETVEASCTLAEWLASYGWLLDTRCGGRGLCRGCGIVLNGASVRACQVGIRDLVGADEVVLEIPAESLREDRLRALSAFELTPRAARRIRPGGDGVGLALDLGTTTLAGALWDRAKGECIALAGAANAQRRYGDNVVARISHAVERPGGLAELTQALRRDSLGPLVERLCRDAGLAPEAISVAAVAGNPVMLHTLIGEPLEGFARYPFRPVFLDARRVRSGELDLPGDYPVNLLPGLGAFVGADITAGALASGLADSDRAWLLIDFGTNGEILLRHRDGFLAAATAVGPAFEGGRLACGSPAAPGVITRLAHREGAWVCSCAEGGPAGAPRRIAGTAYIDFLSVARAEGLLGPYGRFEPGADVRTVDGQKRMFLNEHAYVSEADLAELVQAKAAIGAGIRTVLEQAGSGAADLEAVYVAGAFGRHLDLAHCTSIGLLPDVDPARVRVLGNASLGGASLALFSEDTGDVDAFVAQTECVELNRVAAFSDHFTDALTLAPFS